MSQRADDEARRDERGREAPDARGRRKPGVPPHQPPPEEHPGDEQDERAEETFPSSDPPATGGPGI